MDSRNNIISTAGNLLIELQRLLLPNGKLNEVEVARRAWRICRIDDKALFDEDARRLAKEFQSQAADAFYIARVSDILVAKSIVVAHKFEATAMSIEQFQGEQYYSINLDDCLLFNLPTSCVVLRPGDVGVTLFTGNAAFIGEMVN